MKLELYACPLKTVVKFPPGSVVCTPRMPFAPRSASVFSGDPVFEQPEGTEEKAGAPITWIGVLLACSPASVMSAICTGPQVKPSANCPHSATGTPLPPVCCGNG